MREVDIGNGKALLVKELGEYSAIGHKCSHYGAPLVKGILLYELKFKKIMNKKKSYENAPMITPKSCPNGTHCDHVRNFIASKW